MYLDKYALKELPFRSSPDSRFLYLSEQVNETLQKCLYMIENAIGALYVYAPIGTGKTTLANRLEQQLTLQGDRYTVAYLIMPPRIELNSLLRMVMDEFDCKTARAYSESLKNFGTWLQAQYSAGIKPVVIVDEAQNLTPTHLKLIHFLLNFETEREKLLQVVLFGQHQLQGKIERFPELKSRMYPAVLTGLDRKDTESMIEFRWFVAGGEKLPFPREALDEIFRVTKGMPREIVKLCDVCLLRTVGRETKTVTLDDVDASARELELSV